MGGRNDIGVKDWLTTSPQKNGRNRRDPNPSVATVTRRYQQRMPLIFAAAEYSAASTGSQPPFSPI